MCINDEIDAELKQLAVAAKNFPPKTLQRQQALTELMKKIQEYRTVHLPKNDNFSRETYEEICVEAQQDFWLRICREIHNYRPDREVRQWANFLLKKCFQEAAGKVIGNVPSKKLGFPSDKRQTSDSGSDNSKKYIQIFRFKDLEELQKLCDRTGGDGGDDSYETAKALRETIEQDPGDIFKSEIMKKYPHVNFQMLLLRWLDDVGWQEMSEEFGVKVSTLSSFFQRRLQKFARRFQEYL
jgi:hypothetical protein